MRSKARRLKVDNDLRLIVVDYLQLMRSPEYSENRVQEISDISRSLKALARELEIPVIALSQLSRASEQRGGERKPILSDLRDSGAIEQDADLVIFIHRPEMYHERKTDEGNSCRAWPRSCGQAPQRTDRRRALYFHKQFTRFDNRHRPRGAGMTSIAVRPAIMPKPRSVYRCTECGHEHPKWVGRCEACGEWNAVAEEPVGRAAPGATAVKRGGRPSGRPSRRPPACATSPPHPLERWRTGLPEFDFVLGGGHRARAR